MSIAEVAKSAGLPARTTCYDEDICLIQPKRSENCYRAFAEPGLNKLAFVSRARSLGFSIVECRALLALYEDRARASGDVKALAVTHLAQIRAKIVELRAMEATLADLVDACSGDHRPDCPILRGLSQPGSGDPQ